MLLCDVIYVLTQSFQLSERLTILANTKLIEIYEFKKRKPKLIVAVWWFKNIKSVRLYVTNESLGSCLIMKDKYMMRPYLE